MIRKLIVNVLYEFASACCQVADALTPTDDEIWRERRWKQWHELGDPAVSFDGPPLVPMPLAAQQIPPPLAPFPGSPYWPPGDLGDDPDGDC